ncbi:hypothetical protein IVB14_29610 [Bradyrhizobium sp. 180]|uniref:hypothetical protein n=1 Tax=unclassified Bradyrhizobium TaxID=2631580 RepID=UPI001FF75BB1|nr:MULTISPECIES: hypothetical protein [unclassified Bradyrhizobium]MCK1494454.1 hypothetical protein [Bradyrhizobium sp. 180]MCK1593783.1 hypothetical protein [Bradyrhizobium sp. 164]
MTLIMKPVRRVVKIKQPPAFGKGEPWKALNFRWRDTAGKDHVIALSTGVNVSDVESIKFWWARRKEVEAFAAYCGARGQDLREVYVLSPDRKTHLGSGTLPPGATPDDVAHFFTALRKRGLDGVIVPKTGLSELPFYFSGSGLQMPGAGRRGIELHLEHCESGEREILRVAPHAKLPQFFAGMFYAKRRDYERVLTAHRPRTFMVYNLASRSEKPTKIYELGEDRKYHSIGEIADGDDNSSGFVAVAHGVFGRTPTANELAWLACKLAATGCWLALIKRADEDLDADTVLLMSTFAPYEFESAVSEIAISDLTVG